MENFGIKRHFIVISHSADEIELRSGIWNTTSYSLKDSSDNNMLSAIIGLLDGKLSATEIAKKVNCSRKDVENVIEHLDQLGVLEKGPESALDYYLDNMVPTLIGTEQPIKRKVTILGDARLTIPLEGLLRSSDTNIEISEIKTIPNEVYANSGQWQHDGLLYTSMIEQFECLKESLVVCAFSSIDILAFEAINRASLEFGFPWLHIAVDGPLLIIGPLFLPPKGPCYECFEQRVSMNLKNHTSYVSYKNALTKLSVKRGEVPIDNILANIVASHSALEILNFLNTNHSFVFGKALCVYLPTMEFSYNEVLRLPGCPACGSVAELDDTELYFDVRLLYNETER